MRYLLPLRRLAMVAALAVSLSAGLFTPEANAQSLGSAMPAASQSLPNATGASTSLSGLAGSTATVVIFWSNQCDWTGKYESRVLDLARQYQSQGVQFALINSNSAADFPKESLEASREAAGNYPMAYLKDEGGQLARAFGAARTPQVYVYGPDRTLVYTGAIDDSPSSASKVQQSYLGDALQALASGSPVPTKQTNPFGCMIKN